MGDRMNNDCTVGDLYSLTGSKLLRFYLYSRKLSTSSVTTCEDASASDDSLPDPQLLRVHKPSTSGIVTRSYSNKVNSSIGTPAQNSSQTPQKLQLTVNEDDTFVISDPSFGKNMLVKLNSDLEIMTHDLSMSNNNETLPLNLPVDLCENDAVSSCDIVQNLFTFVGEDIIQSNEPNHQQFIPSELPVVPFNNYQNIEYEPDNPNDLDILIIVPEADEELSKRVIKIHKSNTFRELIDLFQDRTLDLAQCQVIRIMDNEKEEAGQGIGVLRDILTDFWDTFYMRCCEGNITKVPILRHDMQLSKGGGAVASIICNGLESVGYFPIKISLAIFEDAMYGKTNVDLVETFLLYIPDTDKMVIQDALDGFKVKIEDLIDVLEGYDCRKYADAENIQTIIEEIVHKEILQEPKFVIECWKEVFCNKLLLKRNDILQLHEDKKPTVLTVQKLLKFADGLDFKEQITAGYLVKFIKSLDVKGLQHFMRFCSGSNLMCHEIIVEFSSLSGFERRPTSQTCGNVLRLPTSYESVADLREVFINIFKTNMWEIDYV